MTARTWLVLIAFTLSAIPAPAQESVRDLSGPGQHDKFLTPGQLDHWLFEGEKGETIIAHVSTKQFDPVLGLGRVSTKEEKPLIEADDAGSESRFAIRLPEKGKYEIRVHGFKFQGGGNYSLRVQRFQATPLTVGKPLLGTFDREGKGYHYFAGVKDQILVPGVKGASAEAWRALDSKGRDTRDWAGTVRVEDEGESYVIVSGPPGYRYDLVVREARKQNLTDGKDPAGSLGQGEADVLNLEGKPGDFRLVEVEKTGDLFARLVYAPLDRKSEPRLGRAGERPELQFLPVASRGGRLRFVAVLGREGRYQIQLVAGSSASYKVTVRDPSVPIESGKDVAGNLPVGGTAFYSFKASSGQLLQASLGSQKFVPVLRLYDANGTLVAGGDDSGDGLEARVTHMVLRPGTYRLQVSSVGDGGGGDFRQSLKEAKVETLQVGGRGRGTVQPGATEFWSFAGKEGETVFLNVRSSAFEPTVSVRSPDGVLLAADDSGNAATGSLVALKLPRSGRYTVWVSSRRGAGDYTVRLIDGD